MLDYINMMLLDVEVMQNHLNATRDNLMLARSGLVPAPLHRLEVSWLGQNTAATTDDYSNSDCGSACVAMIANYIGKLPIIVTVDEASIATGQPRGFKSLGFADLIKAGAHFGLTLAHDYGVMIDQFSADIDAGKPSIILVNYKSLPASNRYDARYDGGHYILFVGYGSDSVIYHDPYWPVASGGAFRLLTHAEFETAYSTVAPGNTSAYHSLRLV